jgi:hypothetical protein
MALQQHPEDRGDITDVVDFLSDQADNLVLENEEAKAWLAGL